MTDTTGVPLSRGGIEALEQLGVGSRAAVYALDSDRVVKLYHPGSEAFCQREAVALEEAGRAGIAAPRLLSRLEMEGCRGLVLERQRGSLLIDRLRARPWTSIAVGRQLARLHAGIHRNPAAGNLWTLHEKVTDRIERTAGFLPPGVPSRLLAELARLPSGDRLCHGDLQPAHIVLDAEGPVVLDWSDAASGDPVADVALTLFIMRHGAQPPRGRMVNAAASLPRRMLATSYLRCYRSLRSVDDEKLARWHTVVALAWLGIASPADQRRLLRLVDSLPPE